MFRARLAASGRRFFSGAQHHHHHQEEARFLGEAPDRKRELWEWPTYVIVFGGMGWFAAHSMYGPDTRIQPWARAEAEERMRRRERGEEVEFGRVYHEEAAREKYESDMRNLTAKFRKD